MLKSLHLPFRTRVTYRVVGRISISFFFFEYNDATLRYLMT